MVTGVTIFGIALPAWALNAAALIGWVALIGIVFRLLLRTRNRLRCPVTRRMANVSMLRGPDGGFEDVLHCSLVPRGAPFSCGKRCLHEAYG
jgi:hypothetical protein